MAKLIRDRSTKEKDRWWSEVARAAESAPTLTYERRSATMAKKPSEATQIRTLKHDMKRVTKNRDDIQKLCAEYRSRATKAEQECAEWKARFDALLMRTPKERTDGE